MATESRIVDTAARTRRKKWSWYLTMIETLINGLKEYKSVCEFNCIDFNVDKVKLYEEVRTIVASIHPSDFGAVEAIKPGKPVKVMTKVEYENYKSMYNDDLKEIKIGYKRIKEKIKSFRQDYSKAVTCGRSGSGKIVPRIL